MSERPAAEPRQAAASLLDRYLPELLENHYGEWAAFDAASGRLLDVYPARDAFAIARGRPSGEVLLEQVCEPVPMRAGAGTLADL